MGNFNLKLSWHIYLHIHVWVLSYLHPKYILPFFCQYYRFICQCYFFISNVTDKILLSFTSCKFFPSLHNKFSIMSSSASQSLSNYNSLFNNEKTCAEKETKLDIISFIWYNDHILRLDENN